jgi:hypothetical protein
VSSYCVSCVCNVVPMVIMWSVHGVDDVSRIKLWFDDMHMEEVGVLFVAVAFDMWYSCVSK